MPSLFSLSGNPISHKMDLQDIFSLLFSSLCFIFCGSLHCLLSRAVVFSIVIKRWPWSSEGVGVGRLFGTRGLYLVRKCSEFSPPQLLVMNHMALVFHVIWHNQSRWFLGFLNGDEGRLCRLSSSFCVSVA